MLIKAADTDLRTAIETIFNVQSGETSLQRFDSEIRNRELLHYWPLSRVERLTFRSEQLPNVIFKAALPPLLNEATLYSRLFAQDARWTPTFYGEITTGEQVWMFFEDLGARTLRSEPTLENLQRAIILLASFHVAYSQTATDGTLTNAVRLPFFNRAAYLALAQETLKLTTALSQRGAYPMVDGHKLDKLAAIVRNYQRVADGLVSTPQTLVHGDFKADNIILKRPTKTATLRDRLYLIDWANTCVGTGLLDLVDLVNFGIGRFGPEIMLKMLTQYRQAWQAAGGEALPGQPLEELFVCGQVHKKMMLLNWFDRCAIKWIPTGLPAYNQLAASLIEETYDLSAILR